MRYNEPNKPLVILQKVGFYYMSMITLEHTSQAGVTILTNTFIDQYMPQANGDFVKVYIYLLRVLNSTSVSFSLEQMADKLLCTERDIMRALNYWNSIQLLTLQSDANGEITRISLQDPTNPSAAPVTNKTADSLAFQAESTPTTRNSQPLTEATATSEASEAETISATESMKSTTLTPARVKELKENDEIVALLYIAEQYLGKTLTPTEMQKLLYFYDELKLPADLIEYLIEYCVGRNHKSIRYIETVALAWAKEGITSVEMAKNTTSRYMKEYYTILKFLGITNRSPVDTEIMMMDHWLKQFGFTLDIIQEACNRTILQTGQPSFQYTDKILSGWQKKNVHNLKDIQALDAEHKKRKLEKASTTTKKTTTAPNRFNNFQQREYNFEEYEKRLLNQ